jgi:hypothetical protein
MYLKVVSDWMRVSKRPCASSLLRKRAITLSRYSVNSSRETPTKTFLIQSAEAISKEFKSSANWCCLAVSSVAARNRCHPCLNASLRAISDAADEFWLLRRML